MTKAVKRVLVIGGGFSGMSAAIELRKRDIAVDLLEIDEGWRSYGAGITLGGPTLRAFRTLGILDMRADARRHPLTTRNARSSMPRAHCGRVLRVP